MEMDDDAWDSLAERLISLAADRPGIGAEALVAQVAAEAVVDLGDEGSDLVDEVFEDLLDSGELALLAGDVVVAPQALLDGAVLAHVLTEEEVELGYVAPTVDLAPLVSIYGQWSPADPPTPLAGPLQSAEPGATVAVSVSIDPDDPEELVLRLDLADPAEAAPDLVAAFRAAYEAEVAGPGVPIASEDLVWHALLADRKAFARPRPPLTALFAEAGLEVRHGEVADDERVWRRGRLRRLIGAVVETFRDDRRTAERAFAAVQAIEGELDSDLARRSLLDAFKIDEVLELFREVLVDEAREMPVHGDPLTEAERVAEALSRGGGKPIESAVGAYWRAAVLEGRSRPLEALAHLEEAVRLAPDWVPAVLRLAWYRSDMGDADGAIRLLSRITNHDERAISRIDFLSAYSERASGRNLGRNDACWCGSGRKYKVCHLGKPAAAPLPDRISWLLEKMLELAEHNSVVRSGTYDIVATLAGGQFDPDSLAAAAGDPLVPDTLLFGLGGIEEFLAQRAELLPADERELVARWVESRRSLYEIESVEPGAGMRVKDLRSAERHEVRERTFTQSAQKGTVWCARVVPDGESHQLIFGLWPIPPGGEGEWLDMLDRDDPFELLEWRSELNKPPILVTRENEPLVHCRAEFAVSDPAALRVELDAVYEAEGDDGWVEMVELGVEGERVRRASLSLDEADGRLHVETMSRERVERVIGVLEGLGDGAMVELVDRDEEEMPRPGRLAAVPDDPFAKSPEALEVAMQWLERQEEQWCEESVPALGGMTPREAAADPVARETLERLLLSFPEPPPGVVASRPSRLRQLLGL